ncbi:MAG: hypothetical protein H7328_02845, partial [Bdellovibrio sp.]|nr:hypothetical protein [Bdellovibrio sp.]
YNAGSAITSGDNNVVIGSNTGSSIAALSNNILIADGAGNERIRVNSIGQVGIGTSSPTFALTVSGDVNVTGNFKINGVNLAAGGGTVTSVNPAATADNPITVTTTTTTPTIDIARATAFVNGYLASSDFSIFLAKGSGSVTSATAASTSGNPITVSASGTSPSIDITKATAFVNGYLSSSDFSTFNGKQAGSTELTNLAAIATTGFMRRTAANTYSTVASMDLTTQVMGTLPAVNGGTGQSSYATGDLLYASSASALTRLPASTSGFVLTSTGTTTAPAWQAPTGGSMTCPTNYILVPKLSGYTVKDFCVAKYEMKDDGYGQAISQATGSPWVSINRPTSRSACQALGVGYDLISNDQWQTMARDIADVASNWSTGTVYSGELNRGHSDLSPGSYLIADASDVNACSGTGQTCSNTVWNSQRRTHRLSNGNVVWDFAGNVWEWVTNNNTVANATDSQISTFSSGIVQQKYGNDQFCGSPVSSPWCGFGQGMVNYIAGAVFRGGAWNDGSNAGVFAAALLYGPSVTDTLIGFRCVYQP